MCKQVYECICVCVIAGLRMHVCMFQHMHVLMNVFMHTRACVFACVHECFHACVSTRFPVCSHVCMLMHLRVCTCAFLHTRTCLCISVCLHALTGNAAITLRSRLKVKVVKGTSQEMHQSYMAENGGPSSKGSPHAGEGSDAGKVTLQLQVRPSLMLVHESRSSQCIRMSTSMCVLGRPYYLVMGWTT